MSQTDPNVEPNTNDRAPLLQQVRDLLLLRDPDGYRTVFARTANPIDRIYIDGPRVLRQLLVGIQVVSPTIHDLILRANLLETGLRKQESLASSARIVWLFETNAFVKKDVDQPARTDWSLQVALDDLLEDSAAARIDNLSGLLKPRATPTLTAASTIDLLDLIAFPRIDRVAAVFDQEWRKTHPNSVVVDTSERHWYRVLQNEMKKSGGGGHVLVISPRDSVILPCLALVEQAQAAATDLVLELQGLSLRANITNLVSVFGYWGNLLQIGGLAHAIIKTMAALMAMSRDTFRRTPGTLSYLFDLWISTRGFSDSEQSQIIISTRGEFARAYRQFMQCNVNGIGVRELFPLRDPLMQRIEDALDADSKEATKEKVVRIGCPPKPEWPCDDPIRMARYHYEATQIPKDRSLVAALAPKTSFSLPLVRALDVSCADELKGASSALSINSSYHNPAWVPAAAVASVPSVLLSVDDRERRMRFARRRILSLEWSDWQKVWGLWLSNVRPRWPANSQTANSPGNQAFIRDMLQAGAPWHEIVDALSAFDFNTFSNWPEVERKGSISKSGLMLQTSTSPWIPIDYFVPAFTDLDVKSLFPGMGPLSLPKNVDKDKFLRSMARWLDFKSTQTPKFKIEMQGESRQLALQIARMNEWFSRIDYPQGMQAACNRWQHEYVDVQEDGTAARTAELALSLATLVGKSITERPQHYPFFFLTFAFDVWQRAFA